MLKIEEFAEYAKVCIRQELQKEKKKISVMLTHSSKNNGVIYHSLTINSEKSKVKSYVHLEPYYSSYENGKQLDEVMQDILDAVLKGVNVPPELESIVKNYNNFDYVKDRVYMVVVNAERNSDLLKDVPHRIKDDLAVIYKVLVTEESPDFLSITIRNNHLNAWGNTDEALLYSLASINTRRLFPVVVKSLSDESTESLIADGLPVEFLKMIIPEVPKKEEEIYVLSNESKLYGAVSILYDDVLQQIANMVSNDIYIIAPSIGECFAISTKAISPETLLETVKYLDIFWVDTVNQLSDHVYLYKANERTLSIVY